MTASMPPDQASTAQDSTNTVALQLEAQFAYRRRRLAVQAGVWAFGLTVLMLVMTIVL
jgi:hypothetical protein